MKNKCYYFSECPQCGIIKGSPSCCGKGGSWFKNCGRLGDPNFEHTWNEGIKACTITTPKPDTITTSKPGKFRQLFVVSVKHFFSASLIEGVVPDRCMIYTTNT